MLKNKNAVQSAPRSKLARAANQMWRDKVLYLMLAPTLIYFIIFRVCPILNMRLAFYDYKARGPWVWAGLKYFQMLFKTSAFTEILTNTLILSFMKYVLLFPAFVMFALLLNELRCQKFRKYVLTPGGIDDGMTMYRNFRGREPKIDALLKNRGF